MLLVLILVVAVYAIGLPSLSIWISIRVFESVKQLLGNRGIWTKGVCLSATLPWLLVAIWQADFIFQALSEKSDPGPSFDMRGLDQSLNVLLFRIPAWFVCLAPSFSAVAAVLVSVSGRISKSDNAKPPGVVVTIHRWATGPRRLYFYGSLLVILAIAIRVIVWLTT
jgi:hypothetical protein